VAVLSISGGIINSALQIYFTTNFIKYLNSSGQNLCWSESSIQFTECVIVQWMTQAWRYWNSSSRGVGLIPWSQR